MKNTHIPAPLAALVAVTPKEWLLPPLEVAIQRIVALNPEGDGALYVDGEAPAPSPVKSRDALHLWFDRMPWAVIDIDEREEAMRHIAAEEPGLFLGSLNTRETARFLMR
ncbi:hypothetical protein, partial [Roseicyclus sp.]|uniref:hypothetical protein n=1 Tax=Roseicyclus sp. TaxID=1914329 RepID=UPI003F9F45B0